MNVFMLTRFNPFLGWFVAGFGWNWLSHSWVQDSKCDILCWECDRRILISWNAILTLIVVSSILVNISSQIFTMPAIRVNKAWISLHMKPTQTPPVLHFSIKLASFFSFLKNKTIIHELKILKQYFPKTIRMYKLYEKSLSYVVKIQKKRFNDL